MSQRDGFSGGFLLGTIVGGIVGGVVGALLTARQFTNETELPDQPTGTPPLSPNSERKKAVIKSRQPQTDMEVARRSLENKIAQLNDAIDDVRQQLGTVENSSVKNMEQAARPPESR